MCKPGELIGAEKRTLMRVLIRLFFVQLLLAVVVSGVQAEVVVPSDGSPWRVSPDGKSLVQVLQVDENCSMGVLILREGAVVPRHNHPESTESLFVVEGTGLMIVGEQEYSIAPGDAISIPPGEFHSFTATSDGKVVQVYAPPGPEQRFLDWPLAPGENFSPEP